MSIDSIGDLNEAQREAVNSTEGYVRLHDFCSSAIQRIVIKYLNGPIGKIFLYLLCSHGERVNLMIFLKNFCLLTIYEKWDSPGTFRKQK